MDKSFINKFLDSFTSAEKRYVSILLEDHLPMNTLYKRFQNKEELSEVELNTLSDFFIDAIGCYSSNKSVDVQAIDSLIEWHLIIEKGLYKRLEVVEKKVIKSGPKLLLQPNLFNISYFKIFRKYSMQFSMAEIEEDIDSMLNYMDLEAARFRKKIRN